jgi:hypothetical protein
VVRGDLRFALAPSVTMGSERRIGPTGKREG